MNPIRILIFISCFMLCGQAFTQDIDKELETLTEKLAGPIKDHGMKKVTVIDFTELQGGSNELGKYIAEQLTVNLVMAKREFAVLDRGNLKKILAEHKLTAQGLVDPDNAKKFGMFAGVDAMILGTMTPKNDKISLTAKIITTETAEIVGAARAEFKIDDTVRKLLTNSLPGSAGGDSTDENTKVTKKLGDMRANLQSLHQMQGGGYILNMTLINESKKKKSIWVAVRGGTFGTSTPTITSANGVESVNRSISGIPATLYQNNGFTEATEITPDSPVQVTMKFSPLYSSMQTPLGQCTVRMEFLIGNDFGNGFGQCKVINMTAAMPAD